MNTVLKLLQIMLPPGEQEKKKPIPNNAEQYTREIDEAIARVEAGEFYTHKEVERMAKEW